MDELLYKVVTRPRDVIRVHLKGNAANVLVMDDANYANYLQGLAYNYYGGYYTRTPVVIKPGVYGPLNIAINLGGLAGTVSAIVQIVQPRGLRRR